MNPSSVERCSWCEKDDLYRLYHDEEWGIESHDDQHLFEHLILETFQAGLSWHTILRKRENFRHAFSEFNAEKIAAFGEKDIQRLMQDAGIIRNRQKITAAIKNANLFLTIKEEFGSFDAYIWQFVDGIKNNSISDWGSVLTTTPESDAMSIDLKRRGFSFVGSTTCYAYMQAVGMVNDHFNTCWKKNL
jgi:DNA-3-methyladenine glycosylase I